MPPKEGSKVRLVGLKNPDLVGKIGHIASYTRDGERVMISLVDGPQGLVKVKPKQLELIEEGTNGDGGGERGRPGMKRGNSSRRNMRSRGGSRDEFNESVGSNNFNQSRMSKMSVNNPHSRSMMSMGGRSENMRNSTRRINDNGSVNTHMSVEVLETLRSADAMFELADTTGDGVIDQQEFEFYMKKHTDHDQKMIRECFYMIDADGNGDITRDEVRGAFLKKRRDLKGGDEYSTSKKDFEENLLAVSRDADLLFERADIDGDGTLTKREFEVYMKRNTGHSDQAIHDLFDKMDEDRNGSITREEVRKVYLREAKANGEGPEKQSLMDILGLDDEEMAEIEDDVYNMFFLADPCSQPYWFSIIIFMLKLGLILIIAIDLFTTRSFPDSENVSSYVKMAQFLLLPVNVSVQEELIITFFVYANLKWSKEIQQLNPGATKRKYHLANLLRFIDGIAFLLINTTLLLQAEDVLSTFLNFAALQFLSDIDNVALQLARDGYLTESLEAVAGDVLLMKLPKNHNNALQVLDSVLLAIIFIATLVVWVLFTFVI